MNHYLIDRPSDLLVVASCAGLAARAVGATTPTSGSTSTSSPGVSEVELQEDRLVIVEVAD
jgi:hypothetical protein